MRTICHSLKRNTILATLAALLVALALNLAPSAAQATAWGTSYWGWHEFRGWPIPAGQLVGEVTGHSTWVDDAGGSFGSVGNLCNWHIDVGFYDRTGRYLHYQGRNHASCNRNGVDKYLIRRWVRPGWMKIILYRDFGNETLATVQHAIVA